MQLPVVRSLSESLELSHTIESLEQTQAHRHPPLHPPPPLVVVVVVVVVDACEEARRYSSIQMSTKTINIHSEEIS